jgi:hypothetical protein
MTSVAVVLGLVAYLGGAALYISRGCARVDADFKRGMDQVLRSHAGGSEAADGRGPQGLSAVTAGVERGDHPYSAAAPPAPKPLVGAACPPAVAPARPHRVRVTIHA